MNFSALRSSGRVTSPAPLIPRPGCPAARGRDISVPSQGLAQLWPRGCLPLSGFLLSPESLMKGKRVPFVFRYSYCDLKNKLPNDNRKAIARSYSLKIPP